VRFKGAAYRVRELANGAILIQLTEHLDESDEALCSYQACKALVKGHLNSNAFFSLEKGTDHGYSIPKFVWREVLH
jgi:hypothetical protein